MSISDVRHVHIGVEPLRRHYAVEQAGVWTRTASTAPVRNGYKSIAHVGRTTSWCAQSYIAADVDTHRLNQADDGVQHRIALFVSSIDQARAIMPVCIVYAVVTVHVRETTLFVVEMW